MAQLSYRRHRFPAEIIQHAIWLYLRFTLSYRDVEEVLAERGLDVSYETVRRWVLKATAMIGGSASRIHVARLLLHGCADDIEAAAARGEMMEFTARARVRMDCAHAVRQCMEAAEILYLACGGSGIAETNPVQRAWRDLHAVNMHGALTLETNQVMYGRILLGLKPNTPLISGQHLRIASIEDAARQRRGATAP
jgi:hypothetical protein